MVYKYCEIDCFLSFLENFIENHLFVELVKPLNAGNAKEKDYSDFINKFCASYNELNVLELRKINTRIGPGFFGFKSLTTDFCLFYRDSHSVHSVIEIKKIRPNIREECEIKNGLAQVIEQAICHNASHAILLIFDAGNNSNKKWTCRDREYIRMFKNNPFGIHLSVLRIQIKIDVKEIEFERI